MLGQGFGLSRRLSSTVATFISKIPLLPLRILGWLELKLVARQTIESLRFRGQAFDNTLIYDDNLHEICRGLFYRGSFT